jgi:hypothetical protein
MEQLLKQMETDMLPPFVIKWQRSDGSIDSFNGQQVIDWAQSEIGKVLKQHQDPISRSFSSIEKIMDAVIMGGRNPVSLLFGTMDRIALAVVCSRKLEDAMEFLNWCKDQKDVCAFVDCGSRLKMDRFNEVLCKYIVEGNDKWRYFIEEAPIFRRQAPVIEKICEYCSVDLILELADTPLLPEDNNLVYFGLFGECKKWSCDAVEKLCLLLSRRLVRDTDFTLIHNPIVECFESLPARLREFLEEEMRFVLCKSTTSIIEALEKSEARGTVEFCKRVRSSWMGVRGGVRDIPVNASTGVML